MDLGLTAKWDGVVPATAQADPTAASWRGLIGPRQILAVGLVLLAVQLTDSFAQYTPGGGYRPPPMPSYRGPNLAGGASTYGNPYAGMRAPAPPPIRSRSSFYGVPSPGLSSAPKPFSGSSASRPLISSMDAGRISVANGLWRDH